MNDDRAYQIYEVLFAINEQFQMAVEQLTRIADAVEKNNEEAK